MKLKNLRLRDNYKLRPRLLHSQDLPARLSHKRAFLAQPDRKSLSTIFSNLLPERRRTFACHDASAVHIYGHVKTKASFFARTTGDNCKNPCVGFALACRTAFCKATCYKNAFMAWLAKHGLPAPRIASAQPAARAEAKTPRFNTANPGRCELVHFLAAA